MVRQLLLTALDTFNKDSFHTPKFVIYVQCVLLALANLYFLFNGLVLGIEGSLFLVVAIFIWNRWRFVLATMPFCLVMVGYTYLRNLISQLDHTSIHITDLIALEQQLFGDPIPTVVLQNLVNHMPYFTLITFLAFFMYAAFYWVPTVIGILLWEKNRRYYWQFMIGLIILSFLGFAGYYFYPAAPPWWANHYGYLDLPDPKLLDAPTLLKYPVNHTAAMPSLHAAYPTYFAIMIMKFFGRKTFPIILLPILISVSAVYLAHHYIIDIIAGVALAVISMGITKVLFSAYTQVKSHYRQH